MGRLRCHGLRLLLPARPEAGWRLRPSLQAAEEALLARLAGGLAAPCLDDYAALEALNDALLRAQSFSDALDNRDLNR